MVCLICFKGSKKEKGFENYILNPQGKKAILELFEISKDPNVQSLSEDLEVCRGCHRELEEAVLIEEQLEELLRKKGEKKNLINKKMVNSAKISQLMAENFGANRMPKSRRDRCALLKAIEAKAQSQTPPETMDQDEEEVDNDDEEETIDENREEMEVESVQGPSRPPSRSKAKGGCVKRKRTPAQRIEDSSNEESSSESEAGDGSSSEDDTDGEACISSNGSGVEKSVGIKAKRKYRRFKCSFQNCEKSFAYKGNRDKHVKTVHGMDHEGRVYKCTWIGCGKSFSGKSSMTRHVKNVHEKMGVAKKKKLEVGRVISPQADIKPVLEGEMFECRMTSSCRRMFIFEGAREVHENSHFKK